MRENIGGHTVSVFLRGSTSADRQPSGAGVAGITTAVGTDDECGGERLMHQQQALHNASFDDFIMIEHREQVGGRAYHTTFGKNGEGQPYTIELGANWVGGHMSNLCELWGKLI